MVYEWPKGTKVLNWWGDESFQKMEGLLSGHKHSYLLPSKVTVKSLFDDLCSLNAWRSIFWLPPSRNSINRKYTRKWIASACKIPWRLSFFNSWLNCSLVVCPFLIKVECRIHKNDYVRAPVRWNFILLCLRK